MEVAVKEKELVSVPSNRSCRAGGRLLVRAFLADPRQVGCVKLHGCYKKLPDGKAN
jgi:hypothetical protein